MCSRPVTHHSSLLLFLTLAAGPFAGTSEAAPIAEFLDPNPASGNQFGSTVVALSTGNVVITSPQDDAGGLNAGAVYLFNGATGALISTLRGASAGDQAGSGGVTALTNGNFVVRTSTWDNGAATDAGAVTWGSGTTGVSGVISSANSLVGSTASDAIGNGGIVALTNGNYVVCSGSWDNGGVSNVGAVTWRNGSAASSGVVSAANSLVGSVTGDVGAGGTIALTNGNYVVRSYTWNNGATTSVGAATWGNGTTGTVGTISAANSLIGSTASDMVGSTNIVALTNGNYVVASHFWDNGAVSNAGAVTWGNGATGTVGVVSAANSLVGSTASDLVGTGGVTALTNGNYVVASSQWDNGAVVNAGAATWGNGTTGVTGVVSAANSLVGSNASSLVGNQPTVALANGNYVVRSPNWGNGAIGSLGAATWGNGATGSTGVVSAANSLIGSVTSDQVGFGVAPLSNGNYVVLSWSWDNGAVTNAGAATWANGTTGLVGTVSAANSLVGTTANDQVGLGTTIALSNGHYVVLSQSWSSGLGAATWASGTTGLTGAVTGANSLVGTNLNDGVGTLGYALTNGNYVVVSPSWDRSSITDAGAATWGNGSGGTVGPVSAANSLVGSATADNVGQGGVKALANGNYVVLSQNWNNGPLTDAGAATFGNGASGVSGTISFGNSLVGNAASTLLQAAVDNPVYETFIARFLFEGGGKIRVGPPDYPATLVGAVDLPADQGGWLRLTFTRSGLDAVGSELPVSGYSIWRKVPGTIMTKSGAPSTSRSSSARTEFERLASALPDNLESWEEDGNLYASAGGDQLTGSLPPGTWELMSSAFGLQLPEYTAAVPTIVTGVPNDYVVTAHTTTPIYWYASNVVSGQSVDNLPPAQPSGTSAAYASGQTNLAWSPNSENDLDSYRVYRGTSADFVPGPSNLIASPGSPGFGDVGPAGRFYKISAVDVNANESTFALITPDQTTDVRPGPAVAFSLDGARPNPAGGGALHVAFALPDGSPAKIELVDASGRRVVMREVGSLGAGRHSVNLAEGCRLAPGLYWLRLAQGRELQTRRVAVIE